MDKKLAHWLTLDIIIFVVVNIILLTKLGQEQKDILSNLNFFKVFVLGLAVYRTANIISNEYITKPIRAPFVNEKVEENKVVEVPKQRGFLGMVGQLIYCPSCSGVWVASTLLYLYLYFPEPVFIICLFLALSGIERIIAAVIGRIKKIS